MADDWIDWRDLLFALLDEHTPDIVGERLAVLDFAYIHHRYSTPKEQP